MCVKTQVKTQFFVKKEHPEHPFVKKACHVVVRLMTVHYVMLHSIKLRSPSFLIAQIITLFSSLLTNKFLVSVHKPDPDWLFIE